MLTLALSEAGGRALALAIAAAVALAVWFVALAVLALASRADLPDPLGATSDFGGEESPAVAGFLVNRWEVGHEAVPATLLDLAAKKVVAIDQVAPDRFVCRVRSAAASSAAADLADYERQVLDHVRGLTSDGVVPCEALTTGPEADSKGWWERFRKAVVADARRQGLSRSRWSKVAITALGVVAVGPAMLAAAALVVAPSDKSSSSSSKDDNPAVGALALGFVGWFALMAIPFSLRAERDTEAGRAAAARWLGLREYLQDDELFDEAPPAAVAIWDRYLAYGAAMGVAAGAVRALPLGAESDTEAWSSYGGRWHVVRVRYPSKLPPGWGSHPLKVTAKGLGILVVFGTFVRTLAAPLAGAIGDFFDKARTEGQQTVALVATAIAVVLLAVLAVVVLRAAAMFLLGASDLFAKRNLEGQVLRLRNGYLALDDGTRPKVRAWRVEPARLGPATRGAVVRVTASPRLGYVSNLERSA